MKESTADQNKRISEHIREYGWHCLHVHPTKRDQTKFSYTIGFKTSYNGPEVAIFGLEGEKAHTLLNECANLLKAGHVIRPDVEDGNVLADEYKVVFKRIKKEHYGEYLGTATRYYGDGEFDAMVLFLPDRLHRFPWDPGYDDIPAEESLAIV